MFLVLMISLSAAPVSPSSSNPVPPQYIAVGLGLGSMIYAFDHVSGAHFNPAVTFGAVLSRRMSPFSGFLYTLTQTFGAIVGGLLAYAIRGPNVDVNDTFEPPRVGPAFAVEFLYTFALVLVMQNAAQEKNQRVSTDAR